MTTILLALFTGYPLAILKRSGELYYGGQNGFIRDTVFSLIHNSFYGASYFPWQEALIGLLILSSVLCFLIVLFVQVRKGSLTNARLGLSVLAILFLSSVFMISQRVLFGNPYLMGRTALFLIPLFALLLIFLTQSLSRLRRGLSVIAVSLLVIVTILSFYHFFRTANTSLTVDWVRESNIVSRLEGSL